MSEPILYVNACVRKDSRTAKLAKKLLARLDEPYEEIILEDIRFPVVSEAFLNKRDSLISAGNSQDPMFDLARQFKTAETIVIAAPYWDMSFPAMLKQYLEQVNVVGITFKYSKDGEPVGLCRANRLIFVTTAGGCYVPDIYGFGYVRELAQNYYGIQEVLKIEAAGLDIDGADIEKLMKDAEAAVEAVKIYRD